MGRKRQIINKYSLKLILEAHMATLDDKLLGEKLHYYCSSSEDEVGSDDENDTKSGSRSEQASGSSTALTQSQPWDGSSANTGPKGVLKDWQRYKQLETEMREEALPLRSLLRDQGLFKRPF